MRHVFRRPFVVVIVSVMIGGLLTACSPPGTVLTGSVRFAGGDRASGVTIAAYEDPTAGGPVASTTTNLGGNFDINQADLPDGEYAVRVGESWWTPTGLTADPAAAVYVTITAGGPPVSIIATIVTPSAVTGTLVDAASDPLDGRIIVILTPAGDPVTAAFTGADGTFHLKIGEPGDYRVAVYEPETGAFVDVGHVTWPLAAGQTLDVGTLVYGNLAPAAGATLISAGTLHTCAVRTGKVLCWGWGGNGQMGNGSADDAAAPVEVVGITDAVAVTSGFGHSCALHEDNTISCWGRNSSGELGNGVWSLQNNTPVDVVGLDDAIAISAGSYHTCALRAGGTVSCWGANFSGQLGNGTDADSTTPVTVTGAGDGIALASGEAHTCVVRAGGTVVCWGADFFGQLGDGNVETDSPTPVGVVGVADAVGIAAGGAHTCAVHTDGTMSCWGDNGFFQLGDDDPGGSPTPVPVEGGLGDVVDADASPALGHTCALDTWHEISCWGDNTDGQLGDGTNVTRADPQVVDGIDDAMAVTTGGKHTCAIRADETIMCWGGNEYGQLGDGATTGSTNPVYVTGTNVATAVSVGAAGACAVRTNGTVACWGRNHAGQLGNGASSGENPNPVPVMVEGVDDVVAVSAEGVQTCAVHATGTVSCWGVLDPSLGDGHTSGSLHPIEVADIDDAVDVTTGNSFACALHASGEVSCWGSNHQGRLGVDGIDDASTPVTVGGIDDAVAITAGTAHACVLHASGGVSCWGQNQAGQLGDGTADGDDVGVATPVSVTGLGDAVAISGGAAHTCAVRATGAVVCWGMNNFGQLGNGTTDWSAVPVQVAMVSGAVDVATGEYFSCAVRDSGGMWCWGRNNQGQLGNGTVGDWDAANPSRVTVADLSDAVSADASSTGVCAVRADGGVVCWGQNDYGQLGSGTAGGNSSRPSRVVGFS